MPRRPARWILPSLVLACLLTACQSTPQLVVTDEHLRVVDNRLRAAALVDGHPADLIFDTGAETSTLWRPAAQRLHLDVTEPSVTEILLPGTVRAGITSPCHIQLLGATFDGQFRVFDLPPGVPLGEDGVLAWQWLRNSLLSFDINRQRVDFVSALPKDIGSWSALPIVKANGVLSFTTPDAAGKNLTVLIDTGDPTGINLAPAQWSAWRSAHPRAPSTLVGYYSPSGGLGISEVCWADEFDLGPLKLTNVPVSGSVLGKKIILGDEAFAASIGLFGLSRMDVLVDGHGGVIYARPENSLAQPYNHNRLGAVFLPASLDSDPLIAHVLPGTPADEAGIRDGDILRRIGDFDLTHWRSPTANVSTINFWQDPAGTKLDLTLQRDGRDFHAFVTLRDLIGPGVKERVAP